MKTIRDICEAYHITQTGLAKWFGIPIRTVQDWYSGRRVPPEYLVDLIVFRIEHDPAFERGE